MSSGRDEADTAFCGPYVVRMFAVCPTGDGGMESLVDVERYGEMRVLRNAHGRFVVLVAMCARSWGDGHTRGRWRRGMDSGVEPASVGSWTILNLLVGLSPRQGDRHVICCHDPLPASRVDLSWHAPHLPRLRPPVTLRMPPTL